MSVRSARGCRRLQYATCGTTSTQRTCARPAWSTSVRVPQCVQQYARVHEYNAVLVNGTQHQSTHAGARKLGMHTITIPRPSPGFHTQAPPACHRLHTLDFARCTNTAQWTPFIDMHTTLHHHLRCVPGALINTPVIVFTLNTTVAHLHSSIHLPIRHPLASVDASTAISLPMPPSDDILIAVLVIAVNARCTLGESSDLARVLYLPQFHLSRVDTVPGSAWLFSSPDARV